MRSPAEIETILRVMRRQGCPELQLPDLLLKVRLSAKDIRPADETMFPEAAVEERPQPQSYDPASPPKVDDGDGGDLNDLDEDVSDDEAEDFLHQATAAVRNRHHQKAPR